MSVVSAVGDGLAVPGHGGKPQDCTLTRLPMDFGQHHVRFDVGERTLALDRRQLAGVAQHQDRLAEGQQVGRHFEAHHRDLVEHDQVGIAHQRLLVEQELRLVDVCQAQLQPADLRLGECPLGRWHPMQGPLQVKQLLLDTGDLLRRCLRNPIDQAVDGRCRRALSGHHQRCLAGEGREQYAPAAALPVHRLEAEFLDDVASDRALSTSGVPKQPKHLRGAVRVAVPLNDRANGGGLLR